jgi:4-amino-4-deoxy-L-arabinose transferase-like glycosyltransferase
MQSNLKYWVWTILTAIVVLLPGTNTMPLIDRDEPRFAQATVEMMDRGEWFIPYFNHEYRFDKPILSYWMMRVNYNLFGVNEFSARFHTVISSVLTAVGIFLLGRRLFSPQIGFWAAFMWITCFQVWIHGRLCLADMPMILFVTIAQWALYELLVGNTTKKQQWFWILFISFGLGFLAKGPIAILVPIVSLLLYRVVFWRRSLPWKNLNIFWGIVIILFVIGAWGIPALLKTHGLFWHVGINKHVVQRGVEAFNGRITIPFIYYIFTAFLSLFPWIAFAWYGGITIRNNWNEKQAFLLSWLLSPYIIFTFYATQLPHYVLPGFPAFFLLLAQAFPTNLSNSSIGWIWSILTFSLFILLSISVMIFLFMQPVYEAYIPLLDVLFYICIYLFALSILGICVWMKKFTLTGISIAVIAVCGLLVGIQLRQMHPTVQLSETFQQLPRNTNCIMERFNEPSLVFYSNQHWKQIWNLEEINTSKDSAPIVYVHPLREIRLDDYIQSLLHQATIHESITPIPYSIEDLQQQGYKVLDVQGINVARASWVHVRCLSRIE